MLNLAFGVIYEANPAILYKSAAKKQNFKVISRASYRSLFNNKKFKLFSFTGFSFLSGL